MSLEAQSRDTQERTFCKWFVFVSLSPGIVRIYYFRKVEYQAGSEWLPTYDISRERLIGWGSSHPTYGAHLYFGMDQWK